MAKELKQKQAPSGGRNKNNTPNYRRKSKPKKKTSDHTTTRSSTKGSWWGIIKELTPGSSAVKKAANKAKSHQKKHGY